MTLFAQRLENAVQQVCEAPSRSILVLGLHLGVSVFEELPKMVSAFFFGFTQKAVPTQKGATGQIIVT